MSRGDPIVLTSGTLFHGRYKIVRTIRAGGMGTVYEVVHDTTRRRAALKLMLPSLVSDAELRSRFELEARVTADIESDHIVEILDAGVDVETGGPFLVMELLRGEDVRALIDRGPLRPRDVVLFLQQAALALERTHAAGIVHRDLKPDNLFVTRRDDGTPHLKILDFGIAKLVAQSTQSMRTTRSVGTPHYMAPEQIRGDGDIDSRADVYAMGQIAFAMLVGQPYWETESRKSSAVYPLLLKIAEGAKEPATVRAKALGVELPPEFDAWFSSATALDLAQRTDHVRTLVRELARVFDVPYQEPAAVDLDPPPLRATGSENPQGLTSLTASLAGNRSTPPARRRNAVLFAGAGLAAVLGLGLLAARSGPSDTHPEPAVVTTSPRDPFGAMSPSAAAPSSPSTLPGDIPDPTPRAAPVAVPSVEPTPTRTAIGAPGPIQVKAPSALPPRAPVAKPDAAPYAPPPGAPRPPRDPSDTR